MVHRLPEQPRCVSRVRCAPVRTLVFRCALACWACCAASCRRAVWFRGAPERRATRDAALRRECLLFGCVDTRAQLCTGCALRYAPVCRSHRRALSPHACAATRRLSILRAGADPARGRRADGAGRDAAAGALCAELRHPPNPLHRCHARVDRGADGQRRVRPQGPVLPPAQAYVVRKARTLSAERVWVNAARRGPGRTQLHCWLERCWCKPHCGKDKLLP